MTTPSPEAPGPFTPPFGGSREITVDKRNYEWIVERERKLSLRVAELEEALKPFAALGDKTNEELVMPGSWFERARDVMARKL